MESDQMQWIILIKLFLAHFLSDFILQSDNWVNDRKENGAKSKYLYIHSAAAGILSYVLIAKWNWWYVPLIVFITHLLIDLWKDKKKENKTIIFIIDQGLHLISLIVLWLFLVNGWERFCLSLNEILNNQKVLLLSLAYILILWPSGIVIREVTASWREQIEKGGSEDDSLNNAGKWIGFLERILVLTFVILNQFEAIGFLIAAKSILRLNPNDQKKTRKYSEYILFGTLISFTMTIIIGLLIRSFLK